MIRLIHRRLGPIQKRIADKAGHRHNNLECHHAGSLSGRRLPVGDKIGDFDKFAAFDFYAADAIDIDRLNTEGVDHALSVRHFHLPGGISARIETPMVSADNKYFRTCAAHDEFCVNGRGELSCAELSGTGALLKMKFKRHMCRAGTPVSLRRFLPMFARFYGPETRLRILRRSARKTSEPPSDGWLANMNRQHP